MCWPGHYHAPPATQNCSLGWLVTTLYIQLQGAVKSWLTSSGSRTIPSPMPVTWPAHAGGAQGDLCWCPGWGKFQAQPGDTPSFSSSKGWTTRAGLASQDNPGQGWRGWPGECCPEIKLCILWSQVGRSNKYDRTLGVEAGLVWLLLTQPSGILLYSQSGINIST